MTEKQKLALQSALTEAIETVLQNATQEDNLDVPSYPEDLEVYMAQTAFAVFQTAEAAEQESEADDDE